MNADTSIDQDTAAWNAALASGDSVRIAAMQHSLLVKLHERIMNDDENCAVAGWSSTDTKAG